MQTHEKEMHFAFLTIYLPLVFLTTSHELGPLTTTSFSSSNALTSSKLTPSPSGTTNWMPLVNAPAVASMVLNDVGATT